MINQELKQELERKKNRIGLVGTRLEINQTPGNSFTANISYDFKTITMNFGEDLDLVPDNQTQRFAQKKQIQDPETTLGEDILEHETGHRENPTETTYGCPYTVEIHDTLLDITTRALKEKQKQGLENYVCNVFEDILDNINCRRNTDLVGQTLFWNNQGLTTSKDQKFNPFYEAFVKINLILGGNVQDATLLRRFYTNEEQVQTAVKTFINYVKSKLNLQHIVKLHEKPEFETLFNINLEARTKLWEDLAYHFALSIADLLEEQPTEQMFGFTQNPFDQEIKLPRTKQEIAYKRYKQGKDPVQHRTLEEQLYDLYKRVSKEIPVQTSHYTEASEMPLVHFGRRFIQENESPTRFRGVGINDNGELTLKTARHSLNFPVSYKTHPRQFPNLKIALMDRSGSMALNQDNEHDNTGNPINIGSTSFIPWGDQSKYHFALKGYFGIDNFLENQGITGYVQNCVLGFSGEQTIKGKARDVAKQLLVKPSGGTSLDINGLEREIIPDSFVLSISDGEFSITEEEQERLKRKTEEADYAHIQIGQDTDYSTYLRQIGIPVFNVRGDEDLSRIMVDFVSEYYKSQPRKC